jgi:hypothetical protein
MRAWTLGPVLIRVVILIAGSALVAAPSPARLVATVVAVVGVVLAVARPVSIGPSIATAGLVLSWFASFGWQGDPSFTRTIVAAVALYVLHTSTSLAAVVPLSARLDPAVLSAWLLRCVQVVLVAAAVIAASYAIGQRHGSSAVELAGLAGLLAAVAVPSRLLTRDHGSSGP